MNNIYVDGKLHEDCVSCSNLYLNSSDTYSCSLLGKVVGANFSDCMGYKPKECPIKPLSDRLAEERKSVIEKIIIKSPLCLINGKKYYEVEPEFLDQIERGE